MRELAERAISEAIMKGHNVQALPKVCNETDEKLRAVVGAMKEFSVT